MTFEGEVDETIGSHLMFEIGEKQIETGHFTQLGSIPNQKKSILKYECSTETIIKMDMISVEPKKERTVEQNEEIEAKGGSDRNDILKEIF